MTKIFRKSKITGKIRFIGDWLSREDAIKYCDWANVNPKYTNLHYFIED